MATNSISFRQKTTTWLTKPPEVIHQGGVWTLDGEPDPLPAVELEPEEGVVFEFYLVRPQGSEVFPTGRYTFDDRWLKLLVWETGSPGPTEPSRFEGKEFPQLEDGVEWYHEADEDTEVYLEPSDESAEPPATVETTYFNMSSEDVRRNDTRLYKLVDGDWIPEVPVSGTGPGDSPLDPGSYETFSFPLRPVDEVYEEDSPPLAGGTYANRVESHAAVFEVDAPLLELEPPEDIEVRYDEGDRLRQPRGVRSRNGCRGRKGQ